MNIQSRLACLPQLIILIIATSLLACTQKASEEISTENEISVSKIIKNENGYQLTVNGQPFYIKGAGLEHGNVQALAAHGANSFRTWRTDNGKKSGKEVLDEAHSLGLKVTMGIDMGKERHGFDYNDEAAVKEQFDRVKKEVLELKDHPALIIWAIGNELNLFAKNHNVWDAVNDISEMIHEVDPNHLTTTTLAGFSQEVADSISVKAPDLDLLSIQMYGDVVHLPQAIKDIGYDGPFIVTEWGATGYWEVPTTEWEAPLENNSSVKADFYLERYNAAIGSQTAQCIGSYVFLWGQKQERTPTWFGIFTEEGYETESVDVMHYLWNGSWPDNRSPRLNDFKLENQMVTDNVKLKAGDLYSARVDVADPDGDPLTYRWVVMRESGATSAGGDREEIPEAIEGLFEGEPKEELNFSAPNEAGPYRLFIYVDDDQNHTAHANIPFFVE